MLSADILETYVSKPSSPGEQRKGKRLKRTLRSNEWKLILTPDGHNMATRATVYEALESECSSLLICMADRRRITLASGVNVNGIESAESLRETHSHCYHICVRFKTRLLSSGAAAIVGRCVAGRASITSIEPIVMWDKEVDDASKMDLDAAMKDVEESILHWRNRLWLRIVYANVRTIRSQDPVFMAITSQHAVKSSFCDLIIRYQQCKNSTNSRRIDFSQIANPLSVDDEIKCDVPWARSVLDWFANRLVPADLNRRSLYLWGYAGVGKTRFVERLLEGRMCIHRDCAESFFLQGLSEDYEFVWLDEFVPSILVRNKDYRQQFNKLTGRERVMVRVRGGEQYEVDVDNVRTIITSNEPRMTADYFRRRLYVVHAGDMMYDANAEPASPCPTEEGEVVSRRKQRPPLRNVREAIRKRRHASKTSDDEYG
jgi:hypothetical protein